MMHKPTKILLVDDLQENLLALEALLRRDDLELLLAHSGDEALELLLVHDVALAIVDVHMPEMDGFELAELMRSSSRTLDVPIIFVTAGAHDVQRVFLGYESGAVDFLYKPLDPHILRHKVETFCKLHRQRVELAEQYRQLQESAQEREKLVRELKEALRVAEIFAAVLGHDLRTPLSVIMLGAELLRRHPSGGLVHEQAERILTNGRHMSRMIEELLDLSRARLTGGIPLVRKRLDLIEPCARVVDEQRLAHPERVIELDAQGNGVGLWDEDRVVQLLTNLLSNAVRHGDALAAIRVRIDATQREVVLLQIWNGGAIPKEVLAHLFDPFVSHRERQKRSSEGLGLGLFIVDQIVKAHAGSIDVDSNDLEGTRFCVRLPRMEAGD